jgi:hypothetical protein
LTIIHLPAVAIALAGTCPASETAASLLLIQMETGLGAYTGVSSSRLGAWVVEVNWRLCVLEVEGVENADRCGTVAALLLAFPRLLSMGCMEFVPGKGDSVRGVVTGMLAMGST